MAAAIMAEAPEHVVCSGAAMIELTSELQTRFHQNLASKEWLRALSRHTQQTIAARPEFQSTEGSGVVGSQYNEDRYMGPHSAVKFHFIVQVAVARSNREEDPDIYVGWVRYLPTTGAFTTLRELVETAELRKERRLRGEVRLMNVELHDKRYLEIVRGLPRPTDGQTALFASYVADAHSWYKHLAVDIQAPFLFFLDPHAGKYLARDAMGYAVLLPIEDVTHHLHYTAQKTTDYRRRFGCWNYNAAHGTSLAYRAGDHLVDTRGPGPRIADEDGCWVPVPPDLLELGLAEVNALIHPHSSREAWERGLGGTPERSLDQNDEFPRLESHLLSLATPNQDLQALSPKLQERIEQCGSGSMHSLWCAEDLLDDVFAASTEHQREELLPAVLEHLEFRRTEGKLASLLVRERMRQLRSLKAAMHRVVEYVYGAGR